MRLRRWHTSRCKGTNRASFRRRQVRRSPARDLLSSGIRLRFERLEPRLAMAGVVINEFLALNTNGLMDEDGARSDWIELKNTDSAPVNIGGWYLADSEEQWQIPAVTLAANQHLVIFASGKNRAVLGQPLHTNFALNAEGDSLKLLMPDGITVVDAYDPFPPQLANVSYGLGSSGTTTEPLIDESAPVRVHVPTSGVLGTTWTSKGFDNSDGWFLGDTGVGYERDANPNPDYNNYFQFDVNALMPAAQNRDTIYLRIPFNVTDVSALQSLQLLMRYDDGFVAYLNGQLIASRNAPAAPTWSSQATTSRSDSSAIVYLPIDVTAHLGALSEGPNVLAIHGLNRNSGTNRQDFLISPMLVAQRALDAVTGYMATPTPSAANLEGTLGFVADTKFTVDRGFYNSPFNVEMTTATAGAQIRYTRDGSMPTATSGIVYNPATPPLITTTTILRAAAFKAGFTPTNVDTQTYIFLDDVVGQNGAGLPSHNIWGWRGPDWEMDPEIVGPYSGTIKDGLQSAASVSVVMPWEEWFGPGGIYIAGENIERPGSVELFTADGSEEFQIDAALEIVGGTSPDRWKTDKLSLRVTFKQPFGSTKLNAPVFSNSFFGDEAATEFDTLILDAQINFTWAYGGSGGVGYSAQQQRDLAKYIQDQFTADLQNATGGHAPHGRFVHLYINGLYWGMYTLHERPDESFGESYLGGNKDDYDVIKHNATTVVSGENTAIGNYNSLIGASFQNLSQPENYGAVTQLLAIDEFIDYMIVNFYVGNDDWAHHNWYATFNRVDPNGRWRFHSWDAEHVLRSVSEDVTGKGTLPNNTNGPTGIHQRLMASPEYRLRFSDRVQKHFHNGGAMTPDGAAALYAARVAEADPVIVGESARWGDSHREPAYTPADWRATQENLFANYFPNRTRIVQNQFGSRGWLVPLSAPSLSHYGGMVDPGFQLTMLNAAGLPIYYTLDGSDPRDPNTKLPSSSAILYIGPIALGAGGHVNARVFSEATEGQDNDWSAVIDAVFLPETPFPVRITELHYNPAPRAGMTDTQSMEFIELMNTGSQTVSLAGVQLTQFLSEPYLFGSGISLGPGERIVVAHSPSVFQAIYGAGIRLAAQGYGDANLSNNGERIALIGPLGETLEDFEFDDIEPWPTAPDGSGYSLHIIDPAGDPTDPANWRASIYAGGSPGAADMAIPGDYDGNGQVEQADAAAWRASFGLTVEPGTGADGNRDGTVSAADFVVWRSRMMAAPPIPASASAIPASGTSIAAATSQGVAEAAPLHSKSPGLVSVSEPQPPIIHSASRASTRLLVAEPVAAGQRLHTRRIDSILAVQVGEPAGRGWGESALRKNAPPAENDSIGVENRGEELEPSPSVWEDTAWLEGLSVVRVI
jgi:CotH kinase protein/Lamin Tail Domain/Chitobiase/beta-hexosaminidase C-terminal domain/Fn3 associated